MAVSALPVAVIELSFRASLMAVIGAATLVPPGFNATGLAAVTLPAVAVSADPEDGVASDSRTNALTEDHLAMPIHVRREAGLDNGDRSWQVRTSLLCGYLMRLPDWMPGPRQRSGYPINSPPSRKLYQVARLMIDG